MKTMNAYEYRTLEVPRAPKGGDESAHYLVHRLIQEINKCIHKIENKIAGTLISPFRRPGGFNVIYIITLLLFFTSCTSEPQTAEKIFAHFNVRYLQSEHQVKAEAHFSKGIELEKTVPIKMQNGVSFQGDKMIEKEVKKGETRYSFAKKENFSAAYKFEFFPSESKKLDHILKMNSLDEITIQGDFSKSKGVQISWNGKPLSKDESLVFLFNNEKNNFVSFEINGSTSASSINIPPKKLNKFPEGKREIYLVRKQSNTFEQPNVTIISETEFYSHVISVTILP